MINTTITQKPHLSFQKQTLAAIAAIIGAVAVPQSFHIMGTIAGLGTSPGEAFLPMHFPIILVGLLAGPYAGALSGVLGPLVSFALSGMPGATMLPFMMIELCVYGFTSGLMNTVNIPTVIKVLLAQIAGRTIRAIFIFSAVRIGVSSLPISIIWTSITAGIFGIVLQLILLPLIVFKIKNDSL